MREFILVFLLAASVTFMVIAGVRACKGSAARSYHGLPAGVRIDCPDGGFCRASDGLLYACMDYTPKAMDYDFLCTVVPNQPDIPPEAR